MREADAAWRTRLERSSQQAESAAAAQLTAERGRVEAAASSLHAELTAERESLLLALEGQRTAEEAAEVAAAEAAAARAAAEAATRAAAEAAAEQAQSERAASAAHASEAAAAAAAAREALSAATAEAEAETAAALAAAHGVRSVEVTALVWSLGEVEAEAAAQAATTTAAAQAATQAAARAAFVLEGAAHERETIERAAAASRALAVQRGVETETLRRALGHADDALRERVLSERDSLERTASRADAVATEWREACLGAEARCAAAETACAAVGAASAAASVEASACRARAIAAEACTAAATAELRELDSELERSRQMLRGAPIAAADSAATQSETGQPSAAAIGPVESGGAPLAPAAAREELLVARGECARLTRELAGQRERAASDGVMRSSEGALLVAGWALGREVCALEESVALARESARAALAQRATLVVDVSSLEGRLSAALWQASELEDALSGVQGELSGVQQQLRTSDEALAGAQRELLGTHARVHELEGAAATASHGAADCASSKLVETRAAETGAAPEGAAAEAARERERAASARAADLESMLRTARTREVELRNQLHASQAARAAADSELRAAAEQATERATEQAAVSRSEILQMGAELKAALADADSARSDALTAGTANEELRTALGTAEGALRAAEACGAARQAMLVEAVAEAEARLAAAESVLSALLSGERASHDALADLSRVFDGAHTARLALVAAEVTELQSSLNRERTEAAALRRSTGEKAAALEAELRASVEAQSALRERLRSDTAAAAAEAAAAATAAAEYVAEERRLVRERSAIEESRAAVAAAVQAAERQAEARHANQLGSAAAELQAERAVGAQRVAFAKDRSTRGAIAAMLDRSCRRRARRFLGRLRALSGAARNGWETDLRRCLCGWRAYAAGPFASTPPTRAASLIRSVAGARPRAVAYAAELRARGDAASVRHGMRAACSTWRHRTVRRVGAQAALRRATACWTAQAVRRALSAVWRPQMLAAVSWQAASARAATAGDTLVVAYAVRRWRSSARARSSYDRGRRAWARGWAQRAVRVWSWHAEQSARAAQLHARGRRAALVRRWQPWCLRAKEAARGGVIASKTIDAERHAGRRRLCGLLGRWHRAASHRALYVLPAHAHASRAHLRTATCRWVQCARYAVAQKRVRARNRLTMLSSGVQAFKSASIYGRARQEGTARSLTSARRRAWHALNVGRALGDVRTRLTLHAATAYARAASRCSFGHWQRLSRSRSDTARLLHLASVLSRRHAMGCAYQALRAASVNAARQGRSRGPPTADIDRTLVLGRHARGLGRWRRAALIASARPCSKASAIVASPAAAKAALRATRRRRQLATALASVHHRAVATRSARHASHLARLHVLQHELCAWRLRAADSGARRRLRLVSNGHCWCASVRRSLRTWHRSADSRRRATAAASLADALSPAEMRLRAPGTSEAYVCASALCRWHATTASASQAPAAAALRPWAAWRRWQRVAIARSTAQSRLSTASWCLGFYTVRSHFGAWMRHSGRARDVLSAARNALRARERRAFHDWLRSTQARSGTHALMRQAEREPGTPGARIAVMPAWQCWRKCTEARRKQAAAVSRAHAAWRQRAGTRALARWLRDGARTRASAALLRGALGRSRSMARRTAFARWSGAMDRNRCERAVALHTRARTRRRVTALLNAWRCATQVAAVADQMARKADAKWTQREGRRALARCSGDQKAIAALARRVPAARAATLRARARALLRRWAESASRQWATASGLQLAVRRVGSRLLRTLRANARMQRTRSALKDRAKRAVAARQDAVRRSVLQFWLHGARARLVARRSARTAAARLCERQPAFWQRGAFRQWRNIARSRAAAAMAAGGAARVAMLTEFYGSLSTLEAQHAAREATLSKETEAFEAERGRLVVLEETLAAQTSRHARELSTAHAEAAQAKAWQEQHAARLQEAHAALEALEAAQAKQAAERDRLAAALRAQRVAHAKHADDMRAASEAQQAALLARQEQQEQQVAEATEAAEAAKARLEAAQQMAETQLAEAREAAEARLAEVMLAASKREAVQDATLQTAAASAHELRSRLRQAEASATDAVADAARRVEAAEQEHAFALRAAVENAVAAQAAGDDEQMQVALAAERGSTAAAEAALAQSRAAEAAASGRVTELVAAVASLSEELRAEQSRSRAVAAATAEVESSELTASLGRAASAEVAAMHAAEEAHALRTELDMARRGAVSRGAHDAEERRRSSSELEGLRRELAAVRAAVAVPSPSDTVGRTHTTDAACATTPSISGIAPSAQAGTAAAVATMRSELLGLRAALEQSHVQRAADMAALETQVRVNARLHAKLEGGGACGAAAAAGAGTSRAQPAPRRAHVGSHHGCDSTLSVASTTMAGTHIEASAGACHTTTSRSHAAEIDRSSRGTASSPPTLNTPPRRHTAPTPRSGGSAEPGPSIQPPFDAISRAPNSAAEGERTPRHHQAPVSATAGSKRVVAPKQPLARPETGGRRTPEKENGPAHVLRAAANAALGVQSSPALAYAEVNRPSARPGARRATGPSWRAS